MLDLFSWLFLALALVGIELMAAAWWNIRHGPVHLEFCGFTLHVEWKSGDDLPH